MIASDVSRRKPWRDAGTTYTYKSSFLAADAAPLNEMEAIAKKADDNSMA